MKKLSLKLLAILLTVAMLCSMLPVFASAEEVKKVEGQEISKKAEAIIEADIWDKIDAFEDDNIIETRDDPVDATDYAELSDEIDFTDWTDEEIAQYEACKDLYDEYNQAMSYDRNDGMLKVAIGYLESGKKVFYAVGLAHLLNNVNGLVDALREAGYTVELVTYQN